MLKQHNVENADIPCPYDSAAPETLVEQHKAVVEAETAARLARAATNMKKERDKVSRNISEDQVQIFILHLYYNHINKPILHKSCRCHVSNQGTSF